MFAGRIKLDAFFPFLLIERFTDYKIPRLIMFPLLAVASLLGVYDLLFGTLVGPLYSAAIDFSNQALLNSLAVLTLVKVGELLSFVPGAQPIGEIMQQIGDYLANGVLALGFQSAFLILVKKGLFLRYLLGIGFLLMAIPKLSEFGKKLVFGSMIMFFIMPAVVYTEAFLYDRLRTPLEHELKTNYEEIQETIVVGGWGSVKQGTLSLTKKVGNLFTRTDSEDASSEKNQGEDKFKKQSGLFKTLKTLTWSLISGIMLLFIITLMTCLIAPIIAYFLIFKLFQEIFTHEYYEITAK